MFLGTTDSFLDSSDDANTGSAWPEHVARLDGHQPSEAMGSHGLGPYSFMIEDSQPIHLGVSGDAQR